MSINNEADKILDTLQHYLMASDKPQIVVDRDLITELLKAIRGKEEHKYNGFLNTYAWRNIKARLQSKYHR